MSNFLEEQEKRDYWKQIGGIRQQAADAIKKEENPNTSLVNGNFVKYFAEWCIWFADHLESCWELIDKLEDERNKLKAELAKQS